MLFVKWFHGGMETRRFKRYEVPKLLSPLEKRATISNLELVDISH